MNRPAPRIRSSSWHTERERERWRGLSLSLSLSRETHSLSQYVSASRASLSPQIALASLAVPLSCECRNVSHTGKQARLARVRVPVEADRGSAVPDARRALLARGGRETQSLRVGVDSSVRRLCVRSLRVLERHGTLECVFF